MPHRITVSKLIRRYVISSALTISLCISTVIIVNAQAPLGYPAGSGWVGRVSHLTGTSDGAGIPANQIIPSTSPNQRRVIGSGGGIFFEDINLWDRSLTKNITIASKQARQSGANNWVGYTTKNANNQTGLKLFCYIEPSPNEASGTSSDGLHPLVRWGWNHFFGKHTAAMYALRPDPISACRLEGNCIGQSVKWTCWSNSIFSDTNMFNSTWETWVGFDQFNIQIPGENVNTFAYIQELHTELYADDPAEIGRAHV